MILYLMLILNMPFISCHGDGNIVKKINQASEKKLPSKNFSEALQHAAGNQKAE